MFNFTKGFTSVGGVGSVTPYESIHEWGEKQSVENYFINKYEGYKIASFLNQRLQGILSTVPAVQKMWGETQIHTEKG